jgi:hypothetical protein
MLPATAMKLPPTAMKLPAIAMKLPTIERGRGIGRLCFLIFFLRWITRWGERDWRKKDT